MVMSGRSPPILWDKALQYSTAQVNSYGLYAGMVSFKHISWAGSSLLSVLSVLKCLVGLQHCPEVPCSPSISLNGDGGKF